MDSKSLETVLNWSIPDNVSGESVNDVWGNIYRHGLENVRVFSDHLYLPPFD